MKAHRAVLAGLVATTAACVSSQSSADALTEKNVIQIVTAAFPNRYDAPSFSYDSFVDDCRHFGVLTVTDLQRVIADNRGFAEREEARSFAMVKDLMANAKNTPNAVLERGYYYSCLGMARNALRGHVGDSVFSDYELKKANQPPEPTR